MTKIEETKSTRKEFMKKGLFSLGGLFLGSELLNACTTSNSNTGTPSNDASCVVSPSETKGPFPIKTPTELINSNIVSDRKGVALMVKIKVQNSGNSCKPIQGASVDIWHCDKDGYYSEYGGTGMQEQDFTNVHFLRGRQTTDANGDVSFISIYPGWYPGRAPHIHVEVLDSTGKSLGVTQIAFPEDISKQVYNSSLYSGHGQADTPNASDNVFQDSLALNMGTVTGNTTDGYVVSKTIVFKA